ncbi:hypothetical protein B0H12DRAFT_680678 [Mycena haematopus]|nr:hypothetical protein B0H12DRAFT_680678 [Mycena haematopus]
MERVSWAVTGSSVFIGHLIFPFYCNSPQLLAFTRQSFFCGTRPNVKDVICYRLSTARNDATESQSWGYPTLNRFLCRKPICSSSERPNHAKCGRSMGTS